MDQAVLVVLNTRFTDLRFTDSDSCSLGEEGLSGFSGLSRIITSTARYITAHHGLEHNQLKTIQPPTQPPTPIS